MFGNISDKGIKAEKLFEQHLNNENIPFYRIDQNKDTQSIEFKNKNIHRPDYRIRTKNNIFYIDVKYRGKEHFGDNHEERFIIEPYYIDSLIKFQEEFHQDVWLAFTSSLNSPQFCYTTASLIYEHYKNIEKIYEEKKFQKFTKLFIYIPNSLLLFNCLSFEKGFYKDQDVEYLETEVDYLKRIAKYR